MERKKAICKIFNILNKRDASIFFARVFIFIALFSFGINKATAASFTVSPTTGTFTVGSTFDVSILLNTDGKSVNALDVDLKFPPEKLQLVSPKTNVSVISVWTSQPQFNNQNGSLRLQGGIPHGVNVNNATVATLTFRVKTIGNAIIRFTDNSKILLNDGLGTDAFTNRQNAVFSLTLPPPAGPVVASETHSDQSMWYANPTVILNWASDEKVDGYSYVFDENPVNTPDDSVESKENRVVYKNVTDGTHYFHIKSHRSGAWGGTTNFAVNVDTASPASFPLVILPNSRTNVRDPIVKFATTDALSGIDHYEIKFVDLKPKKNPDGSDPGQPFFIEADSPYISPALDIGAYDVFVRAYDKASNYFEIKKRLTITDSFLSLSTEDGLTIGDTSVPISLVILIMIFILIALYLLARYAKKRHYEIDRIKKNKDLPDSVKEQLNELQQYKSKYGMISILAIVILSFGLFMLGGKNIYAESSAVELAPPYVSVISENITNNEIFYIGGKTEDRNTQVIIYTQNISTGETYNYSVQSDNKGEWFYRSNGFLTPGTYRIWSQSKVGDLVSPPSPQITMNVGRAAISFGVSRISYEAIYLTIIGAMVFLMLFMVLYIIYHLYHSRRKHNVLMKEVREAEESLRRGFAILKRDIEVELASLKKSVGRPLTDDEKSREKELMRDLKNIEKRVGKEVWDIERVEMKF